MSHNSKFAHNPKPQTRRVKLLPLNSPKFDSPKLSYPNDGFLSIINFEKSEIEIEKSDQIYRVK